MMITSFVSCTPFSICRHSPCQPVSPSHIKQHHHHHVSRPSFIISCSSSQSNDATPTLYDRLGLARHPDPETLSQSQLREAYLSQAKQSHPDVSDKQQTATFDFDKLAEAWEILSNASLKKVYDTSGIEGLNAVMSIEKRNEQVRDQFSHLPSDQLDMLSETGQLTSALLSPSPLSFIIEGEEDEEGSEDVKDACPRSIEEAIHNVEYHKDESVRYYILWWIYKFKVIQAESTLSKILENENTPLRLRRRCALALGSISYLNKSSVNETKSTINILEKVFNNSNDYFLRFRATEALTNIAYRCIKNNNGNNIFSDNIIVSLLQVLKNGDLKMKERLESSNIGYKSQESLFNIDGIEDENIRKKLHEIFNKRLVDENRSKRTTMTPQLGVSKIGTEYDDEPYEWIIKALSTIISISSNIKNKQEIIETIQCYNDHEVPLVRYAARKGLFCITDDDKHAEVIVDALEYGVEHHYSQRVLIRDLGDIGYWKGSKAITECGMVENSFKILALKNLLSKMNYDHTDPNVKQVLNHMDSLL